MGTAYGDVGPHGINSGTRDSVLLYTLKFEQTGVTV